MAHSSSELFAHSRAVTRAARWGVALLSFPLLFSASPRALAAQANAHTSSAPASLPAGAAKVPFSVGEKLDYEVRFGSLKVGTGTMEVRDIVDVRGRPSWHAIFHYSGSLALLKVNDSHETWFDVETLSSRRFVQNIDNPGYDRQRRFEIYPERGMFKEGDKPEEPSPQNPLDDASFLYFVRTLPLEVGKTYEYTRYFKAQGNPVRIAVDRKQRIKVPAGEFNTVVLKPTFNTKGLFSKDGQAEVYITDDDRRLLVQIKSKLSIGSLNLYLKAIQPGSRK